MVADVGDIFFLGSEAELDEKAWDRLENESSVAYEAFKIYLEMPDRSLPKVSQKLSKSLTQIKKWSSKFNWVERTAAYDSSIVEETRLSVIEEFKKYTADKLRLSKKLYLKGEKILDNVDEKRGSYYSASQGIDIAFKLGDSAFEDLKTIDEDTRVTSITIKRASKEVIRNEQAQGS